MRGDGQVFVVRQDNTLEIRDVVVAKSDRNHVVITAGLEPSRGAGHRRPQRVSRPLAAAEELADVRVDGRRRIAAHASHR